MSDLNFFFKSENNLRFDAGKPVRDHDYDLGSSICKPQLIENTPQKGKEGRDRE